MNEADEIRQQMAAIRHDMHQAVSEVVEEAESALNWKSYVRSYPWVFVGAAVAIGYFLVPRKKSPRPIIVTAPPPAAQDNPVSVDALASAAQPERRGWGLGSIFSGTVGLLWPIGVRAAQAYASGWIESLLSQQQYEAPPMPGGGTGQPSDFTFSGRGQQPPRSPMF